MCIYAYIYIYLYIYIYICMHIYIYIYIYMINCGAACDPWGSASGAPPPCLHCTILYCAVLSYTLLFYPRLYYIYTYIYIYIERERETYIHIYNYVCIYIYIYIYAYAYTHTHRMPLSGMDYTILYYTLFSILYIYSTLFYILCSSIYYIDAAVGDRHGPVVLLSIGKSNASLSSNLKSVFDILSEVLYRESMYTFLI